MAYLKKKHIVWIIIAGTVMIGAAALFIFLFSMGQEAAVSPYADNVMTPKQSLFPKRARIHLYFASKDGRHLKSEEMIVKTASDASQLGESIINMLIQGSKEGLVRTLPKETKLKAFYIARDQIAYVDLSSAIKERHPGGIQTEILTVFSIVNSLILNIPEVKRVKLLIEGQEAETLAGHIDLQHPFQADMLLIQ